MKRAVLYLCARPPGLAGRTLEEEKERGIRYCAMQGYKVFVILKFIGEDAFMENSAWGEASRVSAKWVCGCCYFDRNRYLV